MLLYKFGCLYEDMHLITKFIKRVIVDIEKKFMGNVVFGVYEIVVFSQKKFNIKEI